MKKRMWICSFVLTACLFHLLIPNFVFGQEDARQIFGKYPRTFQHPDVNVYFPAVLIDFKEPGVQEVLEPVVINLMVANPNYIRRFAPNVDDSIVKLLAVDEEFRALFAEEQFHTVLQNPTEIDELIKLIEKPIPTKLKIDSGNKQHGLPNERLPKPFVVEVLDQKTQPLDSANGAMVTFRILGDKGGEVSSEGPIETDNFGKAQTTFRLGSDLGIYEVEASVVGFPSLTQTFTAAAIGGGGTRPNPARLSIVSGDDQSGEIGQPLGQPFVVEVKNKDEVPLSGVNVAFAVLKGNGHLWGAENQTITTNEEGKAGITLTLGPEAGVNRVIASVVGTTLLQQTFTAAGTIVAANASLPVVYWIEGGAIFQFDGGTSKKLITPSMGWTATSLAVNMVGSKLYWTERQTGKQMGSIWRADLRSGDKKKLHKITAVPKGIVVDAKNDRLYWTNDRGKIQSINVDGSNFNGNLIKGLGSPHHIALDLDGNTAWGDIYWTVDNKDGSWSIWSAPFDGSITKKEIRSGLGKLGGIAVDRHKLYWTEKVEEEHGKISSAYKNGSGNRTLFSTDLFSLPGSIPLGLAVDEMGRRLYWTDNSGNIQSLNLDEPIEIVVRGVSDDPAVAIALGRSLGGAVQASPAAPSTIVEHSEQNALLANYPNPFNPETWIPYQLSAPADVSVSIYAVNGHLVRRLDLGHQSAGVYRSRSRAAYWDGRNAFGERVASGLYFYTLTAGDFTATRKMLIRK